MFAIAGPLSKPRSTVVDMQVLMITRSLNYARYGGLSRHTHELSRALKKLECDIRIVCMDTRTIAIEDGSQIVDETIPIRTIPIAGLDLISFNANMLRTVDTKNIDIVHSHSNYGFIFAFIKPKPLVATAHGSAKLSLRLVPQFRRHPSLLVQLLAEKVTFTKADKVIVVSRVHADVLTSEYGIDEEKIVYIPNGVDIEKFRPSIPSDFVRRKYNVEGPLLLCVSRLGRDRPVERLFPVMKIVRREIPKVKLIVAGEGAQRDSLERIVKREGLGESIVFVGALNDDLLPHFYNAADLLVLPTIFSGELTVLEAMACGKVVVYVNRLTGAPIQPLALGNPVAARDENSLARQVISLLQDDKTRRKLGSVSRKEIAANFSWEKVALKTIQVYKSLA